MIQLGQPSLLVLFAVVAAMAGASYMLARWRHRAREHFAGARTDLWSRDLIWPQALLLLAAAALIVFAAARPQWGGRELSRERQGVDLAILLDVSLSMDATDVAPSRLGRAQDELVRLIEAQPGNRVGLVFFAGSAILRSPLTTDTLAVSQLIRRADREGGLPLAGSDIGAALDQALRILAASELEGKAVLVVSDGEDHARAYAARLTAFQEQGIAIYAAGVGTPAGTTLIETNLRGQDRLKVDAAGNPIITRLDESSLRAITADGHGRYLRLDATTSLTSLADDLAALAQTPLGAKRERLPVERFQWFAAVALVLLALTWLAPRRVAIPLPRRLLRLRPRPVFAPALVALLLGACGGGDQLREENADANRLYDAGDYLEALAAYEDLLAQRPDVPELSYNVGNTLHRLSDYDRAAAETQRALPPDGPQLGAVTYYALGNHFLALEELEQAYAAYRNALILDPQDVDAKHNLELTLLLLQERPPPPAQPGQQPTGPGGEPPDHQGEPTDATPSDGQPAPTGTPQPTPQELRRSLEEALRGIDEELTFAQAVEILELLQRQQAGEEPRGNIQPVDGPDY